MESSFILIRIHFSIRKCMFDTFTQKCTRYYTPAYTIGIRFEFSEDIIWDLINAKQSRQIDRPLSSFNRLRVVLSSVPKE